MSAEVIIWYEVCFQKISLICLKKSHIPRVVNLGHTVLYISTIVCANMQVCTFVLQNIVQRHPLNSLYLAVLASPYPP